MTPTITLSAAQVSQLLQGRLVIVRPVKNHDHYGCLTGNCPHDRQSQCDEEMAKHSPTGPVGTVAGVRETFGEDPNDFLCDMELRAAKVVYKELWDRQGYTNWTEKYHWGWHSPVFMPKEFIRHHARKTAMRVCLYTTVTADEWAASGMTAEAWRKKHDKEWAWIETWELEADHD